MPTSVKVFVKNLAAELEELNEQYRSGSPTVPDELYDIKLKRLAELSPEHPFLKKIGAKVKGIKERKVTLPFYMGSLNNVTSEVELINWLNASWFSIDTNKIVIMPKYDGASLTFDEATKEAFTRGDGYEGSDVSEHIKLFKGNPTGNRTKLVTVGEAVFLRKDFEAYEKDYATSRSLIIGKLRNDIPEDILEDATYIRYGIPGAGLTKSAQLRLLNGMGGYQVDYIETTIEKLKANMNILREHYNKVSEQVDIDGLVIAFDVVEEPNPGNNPAFSKAYKVGFDEVKVAKVLSVIVQVTKQGILAPVIEIQPTKLDGAVVTNVYVDNFRTVKNLGIGVGARVNVKRSGKVIPRVVDVVEKAKVLLPRRCPSCGSYTEWNETGANLVCTDTKNCPEVIIRSYEAFFSILNVDSIGYGVCASLYQHGMCTSILGCIKLLLNPAKMSKLPTFGEASAAKLSFNLATALDGVSLHKLQHASGYFHGLGSTRLAEINKVCPFDQPVFFAEVLATIPGISYTLADVYIAGAKHFLPFYKELLNFSDLLGTEELPMVKVKSEKLAGVYVFTGFRSAELEKIIMENGGTIGNGVTKKTTVLIHANEMKDTTTKLVKAREAGIEIFSEKSFRQKIEKK